MAGGSADWRLLWGELLAHRSQHVGFDPIMPLLGSVFFNIKNLKTI